MVGGASRRKKANMKNQFHRGSVVGVFLLLQVSFAVTASVLPSAQTSRTQVASAEKVEAVMTLRASGTFEVKLSPLAPDDKVGDPSVGGMSIDKQFLGDLEATSLGQMLTVMTEVEGSAGYVAMERVKGTLQGRSGTFALQHSGTMAKGAAQLTVTVVPDSGTGELMGLAGTMSIDIVEGEHRYSFEYALPRSD